jgi:uncharacterized protein (TIGR00255 family)
MTLLSMTGYGRSACEAFGRRIVVEIRSVNHRFFDFKVRAPWMDAAFETQLLQAARRRLDRGAVTVSVREELGADGAVDVRANVRLARGDLRALDELRIELALPEPPSLALLAQLRDVIVVGDPNLSGEQLWEAARGAVEEALDQLAEMRAREGKALAIDLLARVERLRALRTAIGELGREAPVEFRRRLEERLASALRPGEVDPARLAQEVVIFSDRADISEELTRLDSHLVQFQALVEGGGPVGRKLDFLVQELNREVNTIGAKSQSGEIARQVVDAKAEIEKMREQIQNVE